MADQDMSREDCDNDGRTEWQYSIYLVGFRDGVGPSAGENRVADMISHLVPEARVVEQRVVPGAATTTAGPDILRAHDEGRSGHGADVEVGDTVLATNDDEDVGEDAVLAKEEISRQYTSETAPIDPDQTMHRIDIETASVASLASLEFSPAWIEKEATALLDSIMKQYSAEPVRGRSEILLAGYAFGGFVMKQAVVIANTNPRYYSVAQNISSLIFFASPHHSDDQLAWEGVLLDMVKTSYPNYSGRLSQVLAGLVDSVTRLSHLFLNYATKYPITNFIDGKKVGPNGAVVGELGKFSNEFQTAISLPQDDFKSLMFCRVDDLDKMKLLRAQFAPPHLLKRGILGQLHKSESETSTSYLAALQALAPSSRILHDVTSLEQPEEFARLKEVCVPFLRDIPWKQWRQSRTRGVVQLIGPAGHGKSFVMKLICQEARRTTPTIVVESFPSSHPAPRQTRYGVYTSIVHQVLSQRPSAFRRVRKVLDELLSYETWSEGNVEVLLKGVLQPPDEVEYIFAVYDFEDWPDEVRSWWFGTLYPLLASWGIAFNFLTSSRLPVPDLGQTTHLIDLAKRYRNYRQALIRAKTQSMLDDMHGSTSLGRRVNPAVRKLIMSKAISFEGSFAATNAYVEWLFRNFTLNTMDAIISDMDRSPRSEPSLFWIEIERLDRVHPRVQQWAVSALSWILASMRPLRLEELAVATALNLSLTKIADVRPTMSMDIEHDLRNYLGGIVSVESGYIRIASKSAAWAVRTLLAPGNHYSHAALCLLYLQLALSEDAKMWEKCLTQVTWMRQGSDAADPELGLLDYACRFWHRHLQLVDGFDRKILEKSVAKFLATPTVGDRWFQLYQLTHSQLGEGLADGLGTTLQASARSEADSSLAAEASSDPSKAALEEAIVEESTSQEAPVVTGELPAVSERPSPATIEAETTVHPAEPAKPLWERAVRTASFLGLDSVVSLLLEDDAATGTPERHIISGRRGCLERSVVVFERGSKFYLDCAICNDDEGLVGQLFADDAARTTSYNPLHKAAASGALRTCRLLLGLLEDPTRKDSEGRTALHFAALSGHAELVRLLLGDKAPEDRAARRTSISDKINAKDDKSRTPLITAARMGNLEVVRALIKAGADRGVRDGSNRTALDYAIWNCPQAVKDLVAGGAAYDGKAEGVTPLHTAVLSGELKIVLVLLDTLRDEGRLHDSVNAIDPQERTALHYAAELGNCDIVDLLLENGAITTLPDYEGQAAAERAAARGHLGVVETLMAAAEAADRGGPSGNQLLQAAIQNGQLLLVQYLLQSEKASPNSWHGDDLPPLSHAAAKGYDQMTRTLLRYGANINIEDSARQTPLHHAAINGQAQVVRTLLEYSEDEDLGIMHLGPEALDFQPREFERSHRASHGAVVRPTIGIGSLSGNAMPRPMELEVPKTAASLNATTSPISRVKQAARANPNAPDIKRQTPLHWAAKKGHYAIAELLLKHRASVRALSRTQETPLHLAVGHPRTVEVLLNYEADLATTNMLGQMALHLAAMEKQHETVRLLLERGADIDARDQKGRTPLQDAVQGDDRRVVESMYELRPKLRESKELLEEVLRWAVEASASSVIEFLFAPSSSPPFVDPRDTDYFRGEALPRAVMLGSTAIALLLLGSGADVNARDGEGATALYHAAVQGHVELMQLLLTRPGIDVNLPDSDGLTPLHCAASKNILEVVEAIDLLLGAGAGIDVTDNVGKTPLFHAAYRSRSSMVLHLLKQGADIRKASNEGWTALHAAADNLACAQALIENGAEINALTHDGWTPLHFAICWIFSSEQTDIIRCLAQGKADPDLANDNGDTALHLSIGRCSKTTIRTILSMDPDLEKENEAGQRPIHRAVAMGDPELVGLLIEKGAELMALTANGVSALEIAVENGGRAVLELLLTAGRPAVPSTGNGVPADTTTQPPATSPGPHWSRENLGTAFWKAVQKGSKELVEPLIKRDPDLVHAVADGVSVLETCLRSRSRETILVAILLLEHGADPFRRLQPGRPSSFELAVFTRWKPKVEFLDACVACVPADPVGAGLGFKELRIAAELDSPALWDKLAASLLDSCRNAVDDDAWTLHHFVRQAGSRIATSAFGAAQPPGSVKTPSRLVVPEGWYLVDTLSKRVQIAAGGLQVSFAEPPGGYDEPIALRADHALPPKDRGLAYYEVKISRPNDAGDVGIDPIVGIGLAGEFTEVVEGHVGWYTWTVAFHGDDGGIFQEAPSKTHSTGKLFGPGRTVGCGIDHSNDRGEYYFTLDGELVGRWEADRLVNRKLYPVISHAGGACNIDINFGQDDFLLPPTLMVEKNKAASAGPRLQRRDTNRNLGQSRERESGSLK